MPITSQHFSILEYSESVMDVSCFKNVSFFTPERIALM